MDASKTIKMVQGLSDLKSGLVEFFEGRKRKFEGDNIVTEDEVREFFKGFNKKTKYGQDVINEV